MEKRNIFSKEEEVPAVQEPVVLESKPLTASDHKNKDLVNIIDFKNITQKYVEKVRPEAKGFGRLTSWLKKSEIKETVVFDGLNFSVRDIPNQGQFISIVGKSGCGKTTLLRYLSGIQQPTAGDVYIYGKQITDKDRIPMVFQQYTSFEWKTVLQNVALPLILQGIPKKEAYERAMAMIQIVGLDGHQNKWAKMPLLSGGQLQRVAIARNLVANPQILLMDEPFSGLDPVTKRHMLMFMRHIFEGAKIDPTVIFVTHEIRDAVFLSTDVFVLDANPATIKCHLEVDLSETRTLAIRKTAKFDEQVAIIDGVLDKLSEDPKNAV